MSQVSAPHIHWHDTSVTKQDRCRLQGHRGCTIWLTGLSGSGKSTLANAVEKRLVELGTHSYVLDGDNIRHGLNRDLGFSPTDRKENIRRIGEVSKLFVDAGVVALTAFISPYQEDRDSVRNLLEDGEFIEVYVKCSLEECEKRDPKGLYQKARKGEIPEFTGISAPYEEPVNPELVVETEILSLEESVNAIVELLKEKSIILC